MTNNIITVVNEHNGGYFLDGHDQENNRSLREIFGTRYNRLVQRNRQPKLISHDEINDYGDRQVVLFNGSYFTTQNSEFPNIYIKYSNRFDDPADRLIGLSCKK